MSLPLSYNGQTVASKRYARLKKDGNLETWGDIAARVVDAVVPNDDEDKPRILDDTTSRIFIPNTPLLVNAGIDRKNYAACFVIPVEDSIEGIMQAATDAALIHQTGGGTGFSFEHLRPNGANVNGRKGAASGPVSFMNIFNTTTDTIKQGGVRRGANMGIMAVSHPDILRFIHAKNDQTSLTNFNISVTVSDKFMNAVFNEEWIRTEFNGENWLQPVFDPKTGKDYEFNGEKPPLPGMVYAPDVWQRIIESAWQYAEPGIIFIDRVNDTNLLKATMGKIYSCNPCGEQFLHDYNSCNLGSIDVSKLFSSQTNDINWYVFQQVVKRAVKFLDLVIDACDWPLDEIAKTVKRTRPIGLGLMGIADLLLLKKMKYGSEIANVYLGTLFKKFQRYSWEASLSLGKDRGTFPELDGNLNAYEDFLASIDVVSMEDTPLMVVTPRNYQVTTIAPTGTISLIAECSSGIEPNFAWAYVRRDTIGTRAYVHPLAAAALGITYDNQDPQSIAKAAQQVLEKQHLLPDYFITAQDLSAVEHLSVLEVAQKYIDNSISKTCNGAATDTVADVDSLYRRAYKSGVVKCVSYYRDGSREGQVLTVAKKEDNPASDASSQVVATEVPQKSEFAVTGITRKPRPVVLNGKTYKFDFDGSKLYITVNKDDDGDIVELFITAENNLISPIIGKLITRLLTLGDSIASIANCIGTQTGVSTIWFNQSCITSPEQAIAAVLRLESKKDSAPQKLQQPVITLNKELKPGKSCPKCNGQIVFQNGCSSCQTCGDSKCS